LVESTSSPYDTDALDQALEYCADQLKQFDRDRYTICAGVSQEARRALFALYAFNLEIAKTREVVSEPMLGQIRLQWWRDAIEEIYLGRPRDHVVVRALAAAIERHQPPQERFVRLINAREFDLEDRQPDTIEELLDYAEATSGELTCLALHLLEKFDGSLFEKSRLAGIAWALTGLLYAVPFHAAQGRCYLPKKLTEDHGVSIQELYAGSGDTGLCGAISELAIAARHHLELVGQDTQSKALHARPAFAGLSVVAADLKRLEKSGYDVFAVRPMSPFLRRLRLMGGLRWLE
jgi:phytoene synthase